MKLSRSQRSALRYCYSGRYLLFRPVDVPGGTRTVRALLARGYMERVNDSGHVRITPAGIEQVRG